MENKFDCYFSPNEFYKWRRTELLRKINCFYIDVDCSEVDFKKLNQSKINRYDEFILEIFELKSNELPKHKIPSPNCVVGTGREFHLYSRIKPVGRQCLPRWNAAMDELVNKNKYVDKRCKDAI